MEKINGLIQKEWKDWVVDQKLGQGSYGTTYRAKRESYGFTEWAAIKHISIPSGEAELNSIYEELATRDASIVRKYLNNQKAELLKEYEQMKNLPVHTNIVGCHDIVSIEKEDGLGFDIFIRMELLEPLTNRIMNGKMDRGQTIKLGVDLCNALILLQEKKIIHRDIKPQNIFVNESGDYKLGDFGTARSVLGSVSLMSVKGTVAYMPPEVMQRRNVSYTADIYSLGLVMYRLMNGNKSPFLLADQNSTSTSIDAANNRRLDGEELPAPADADQQLGAIIMKACAFLPEDRWQSAREFRDALYELQNGTVKKVLTPEELKQIRLETLQKEQEQQDKKKKKIEEEQQTIEKNKKKKVKTILICVAVAVLLVAGGLFAADQVTKNNQYQDAVLAAQNGELEEALAGFTQLGNYKDAHNQVYQIKNQMIQTQAYDAAMQAYQQKDYAAARTAFAELKGFSDADAWVEKLDYMSEQYDDANNKMRQSKYSEALKIYEELAREDYRDTVKMRKEAQMIADYRLAEEYEAQNKLNEALTLFADLESEQFEGAALRRQQVQKKIDDAASYKKAAENEKNKKYKEARDIYLSIRDYQDAAAKAVEMEKYVKYDEALKLYNAGDFVNALSAFAELTGFEKADSYHTKAEKEIEKQNNAEAYQKALGLENEKKYQAAYAIYSKLGQYQDAAARATEMNRYINYQNAVRLFNEKEYEEAFAIFDGLGDFEDAKNYAKEANNQIQLEKAYQQALKYEENGQYRQAQNAFAKLGDYKQAAEKVQEMQKYLDYEQAERYMSSREYQKAIDIYAALGDFEDAQDCLSMAQSLLKEQNNEKQYRAAKTLEENRQYEEARAIYLELGDYSDAEQLAAKMSRHMEYDRAEELFDAKKYEEAFEVFTSLKGFSDAADRAAQMELYIRYQDAVDAYNAKEYEKARDAFIELSGFEKAEIYLEYVNQAIENQDKDAQYEQAVEMAEAGEHEAAYHLFKSLGNHKLAAVKAAEMEKHVRYNKAVGLYNSQKYSEALDVFEELGDFEQAAEYAAKADAEIQNAHEYSNAADLAERGNYKNAKSIYLKLGEYKDAAAKAAEMQRYIDYEQAKEHEKNGEYQQAIELYTALGDFENSAILLSRAKTEMQLMHNSEVYKQAQQLESQKKYQEALNLYASLGEYQEASQDALRMRRYLDYQLAQDHFSNERFEEAIVVFKALEGFQDSERKITEAQTAIANRDAYKAADKLAQEGKYQEAKDGFEALGRYKDAADKVDLMQNYLDYNQAIALNKNGEFESALKIFTQLGEFEKATAYAADAAKSIQQKNDYAKAQELEGQQQLKEALKLYTALGSYKDAATKANKLTERIEWLRTAQLQDDGTYVSLVNGDNLLSGSLAERTSKDGKVLVAVADALTPYDNQDDRPITISFDAKATGKEPCTITVGAYNNSGVSVKEGHTFTVPAGEYKRFTYTTAIVKRPVDRKAGTDAAMNDGALCFQADGNGNFSIQKIKIEIGKKNTGWTFAQKDPLVTGNNLLSNSAQERKDTNGLITVPVRAALEKHVNMPLVVSFDAKSNGTNPHTIRVYAYQSSGISIATDETIELTKEYKRYSFKTTVKDYLYRTDPASGAMLSSGALAFYDASGKKQLYSIRNIKLEVATKATEWTLSPDDPLMTGENLLANGAKARYSANSYVGVAIGDVLKPYADTGVPICISFEAKMLGNKEKKISVYPYQETGISIEKAISVTINPDRFEKFSIVTTAHNFGAKQGTVNQNAMNTGTLGFYDFDERSRDEFVIRKIKVEVGYKATDYTYAANDKACNGENLLSGYGKDIKLESGLALISVANLFKAYEGMPISISFEAKSLTNAKQNIRVYAYQESGMSIEGSTIFEIPADKYEKFTLNTTVLNYGIKRDSQTGAAHTPGAIAFYNLTNGKQPFALRHVKIEIGTKATAFTLAPNDPALTGENLLAGYSGEKSAIRMSVPVGKALKEYEGMPITISFDAKSNLDKDCVITVGNDGDKGVSIEESRQFTLPKGGYKRYSMTTTVHAFADGKPDDGMLTFYTTSSNRNNAFSVRKIKIEIGQKATEWYFSPDDPLVSGENLLVGYTQAMESKNRVITIPVKETMKNYQGLPVTISFEASTESENAMKVRVYAYQNSGVSITDTYEFTPPKGTYKRFSFTTTVQDLGLKKDATGKYLTEGSIAFYDSNNGKDPFTIRKVKIEIGKTATSFTFAPNDPLISGDNVLANHGLEIVSKNGLVSVPVRSALEKYVGLPITVSFEAKSNGGNPANIKVYAYQNSGISVFDAANFALSSNGFSSYSFKTSVAYMGFKANQETGKPLTDGALGFFDSNATRSKQEFTVRRIKIEIGHNDHPQWSMAANDKLITGKNLLYDEGDWRYSKNSTYGLPVREALENYAGMPIAISFEAQTTNGNGSAKLTLSALEESGISIADEKSVNIGSYMKRYTILTTVKNYSFKIDQKTGKSLSDGQILFSSNYGNFAIRKVKIEIGYRSTNWMPPDNYQNVIIVP